MLAPAEPTASAVVPEPHARAEPRTPATKTIAELETTFLTMASSYGTPQRREMLLQLRASTAGDPNADAVIHRRLLEWITAYGTAEDPIEILEDDHDTA
ncbi:MAG: hypothetical protein IAG13_18905 [Deltaproteobacteria bacterium]|nr:hypothetical protein [Nannocystaceae bacterium]